MRSPRRLKRAEQRRIALVHNRPETQECSGCKAPTTVLFDLKLEAYQAFGGQIPLCDACLKYYQDLSSTQEQLKFAVECIEEMRRRVQVRAAGRSAYNASVFHSSR